jgi:lipoyl(octanoyl) transferase
MGPESDMRRAECGVWDADCLRFLDLGRISYRAAYDLQQTLHAEIVAGTQRPTVLLLEHDPVITVTKREGVAAHLLSAPQVLRQQGIEVVETDRGGDVTYHGPGQLVVYPIVPLRPLGLNVRQYMMMLEEAIIRTLAQFGVTGRRDSAGIGVWVDAPQAAKIAAIGVRVSRWVTLHGLAVNVSTNLDHFRHIVPCGLPRPVASLRQLVAGRCPTMEQVKRALQEALTHELRFPAHRGTASRTPAEATFTDGPPS